MVTQSKSRASDIRIVLLRAAASLGLLAFVLYRTDTRRVLAAARDIDPRYLTLVFLFICAAIIVNVYEWGLIVRSRLAATGFATLLRYYLVGLFFNSVFPTAIGGDVVRGYEMSRETGDSAKSAASILSDRLVSGIALGLAALVGLLAVHRTPRLVTLVLLFAAACVSFVALVVHPKLLPAVIPSLSPRSGGIADWTQRTAESVRGVLTDLPLVGRVAGLAVLAQMFIALTNVFIFRSLGERLPVGYALVYVPIIFALTMVPVSLSGLGVRETAYVYFFTRLGISAPHAVAASLMFFLAVAVASLPGAVFFTAGRRGRRRVYDEEATE